MLESQTAAHRPQRPLHVAPALQLALALTTALLALPLEAQPVQQIRGIDSRVDYAALKAIGPWDDRNYQLTQTELDLLAPNEAELKAQIPAFFRVELRQGIPEMRRTGPVQYPRSALQIFRLMYGGYLVDGKIYTRAEHLDGSYKVLTEKGGVDEQQFWAEKFLDGEVKVTNPNGAAESAIKINPVNTDLVIAGSNGPGTGQKMHYSTDGGETWSGATLPLGGTCCDPTVDWSSDGSLAYTATLGNCGGSGCQIWFYRSGDGGQTWTDLPGTDRRTLSSGNGNDKEFIHVDQYATSPHKDNIYATWHSGNVMQFARSTDFGDTWSAQVFSSASDQQGIGSDITTDKNGHVYYFWPAFNSRRILLRKSTDGGASFGAVIEVDSTEGSFAFPVPSMETREVFMYVAAGADYSSGPYGGSVYAAWTDSTAATSSAANNHARIQVAYSRNGGSTWTVTTPHETADSGNVDRFHEWLSVGADGKVHVIFYDTRRSASRTSVDLFYSFSADGAQTWSIPTRVTAQQSPNIGDSFEFGDYNGMDIVMQDLIAIYTDNRNEGGGGGDSVDVYAAGIPVSGGGGNTAPNVTITAPAGGSSVPQGTAIAFAGSATDAEDGSLTASLAWASSLDGSIGSGGGFSNLLSAGTHTVTASVTDSGGLAGSAQITVIVTVPCSGSAGGVDEDFESGMGSWTAGGLWHLAASSSCASPGYSSPVSAMYYGQDAACDYDTGAATSGDLISPEISGINADSTLTFDYFRQVESSANNPYDTTEVAVSAAGSGTWTTVWSKTSLDASANAWTPSGSISLAAFDGNNIQLRFRFDSSDEIENGYTGWLVDDVVVTGSCGGCALPPGHFDYCNVCGPCATGEGDCDGNAQCDSGLACVDDVGANYGFPAHIDVCEQPSGCALPPGHYDYCTVCGPCAAGEGDCDGNAQCDSGLACVNDVGANYGFPAHMDVCEQPSSCALPPGHYNYCTECGPCAAGEGDCDGNAQCDAGLACVNDVGANYGFPAHMDVCE